MYYESPGKKALQQVMVWVIFILVVAVVVVGWIAVKGVGAEVSHFDTMMRLSDALEKYRDDKGYYPEELRAVEPYLDEGGWPENPYTHQPVVDTGTDKFDPKSSPGNVYYDKFYYPDEFAKDRVVVGFTLHVFERDGKERTYGSPGSGMEHWFDERRKRGDGD